VVRSTHSESLINAVNLDKPKMLTPVFNRLRLEPKGTWLGLGASLSPNADVEPPANRRDLTHSGTHTKRGKPLVLPQGASLGESEPQGTPTGLRVKEDGKSEGRSVIKRIGVESLATLSHAKARPLPSGLSHERA